MPCSCLFCDGTHWYWWPSMSYMSYTCRTLSLPDLEFKLALSALTHQFTSSSYLPRWHRRASEVWNWWRCACENVSGGSLARERVSIFWKEVRWRGWRIGVAKAPFHEHWTVKWRTQCKQWPWSIGYGERLLVKAWCQPACTERERKRRREGCRQREWQRETQTEMRYLSLLVWGRKVREVESRRSRCLEQSREWATGIRWRQEMVKGF